MTHQSKEYKRTQKVDVLGDLPGADRAADLLRVSVVDDDHALTTKLAAALSSNGDDTLLVEQAGSATHTVEPEAGATFSVKSASTLDVEQATPVGVEDSTGTQINPATEGTLSSLAAALASNAGDTLQVDQQGVVDVSSRDSRNLGDVDVTALPDHDEATDNGTALASGGSISHSLAAPGAETLRGRVVRASTSYDVTVEWTDGNGNVLFTTSVATGVAAGTETPVNEPAISPYCNVVIADAGAASGAVTSTLTLR